MLAINKPVKAESDNIASDISQEVLKRRCLLKDSEGNIVETPEQMYWRVANAVAAVEKNYDTPKQTLQLLICLKMDSSKKLKKKQITWKLGY